MVVKAALIQPVMQPLVAQEAVAAPQITHQLVPLVILVATLQLKVMQVVEILFMLLAHTLLVVVVDQVPLVLMLLAHQLLVMAVLEQLILFLVLR